MWKGLNYKYKSNYNCKLLTIDSILSRKIEKTEHLWSQSGFVVYYNDNEMHITSDFMTEENYLARLFNIKTVQKKFQTCQSFYHSIEREIEKEFTIFLKVDLYYLPLKYNMYFEQKHQDHYLEIVNFDEEYIYICDHFYRENLKLHKRIVQKANEMLNKNLENPFTYDFTIFDTSNMFKRIDSQNLKAVLQLNSMVLNGEELKEVDQKDGFVCKYGLNCFSNVIKVIKKQGQKNQYNEDLYRDIVNLSDARYRYAYLMKNIDDSNLKLQNIYKKYIRIAQNYRIIANLILKVNVTGEDKSVNIEGILKDTKCLEIEANNRVYSYIQSVL